MKKIFWDHLLEIEDIKITIDKHGLVEEEKIKLLEVVHQTIDAKIMETILSHLPKEKHRLFLDQFSKAPHHPKLLDFLKKEIQDIEEKIKVLSRKLKQDILKELSSEE